MLVLAILVCLLAGAVVTAAAARAPRWRRAEALKAAGFLAPSLIHVSVFLVAPLLFSLYMSGYRWGILTGRSGPAGGANYAALLWGPRSGIFWRGLLNTGLYALQVPVTLAAALAVALGLNRSGRARALLQTVFFLPSLCLLSAVAVVWKWVYNPEFGLIRAALEAVGLSARVGWLTSPDLVGGVVPLALLSVMAVAVWSTVGVQAVIFLAGLRAIPQAYYDAARVDGASSWQTFRHVTLPLLKPTTLFLLVTSVIASFQVFTLIYVMLDRALLQTHRVDVLVYLIYDFAWGGADRLGLASALSWVLFLIILGVTAVQFRIAGREASP